MRPGVPTPERIHFEIHPPGSVAANPLLFLPEKAQPLGPDPAPLSSRPTSRFDASINELVRDGVLSPVERARISSGSGMTPFNVPAHQQACHDGRLSPQECSSGVVVRWRGSHTISGPTIKPLSRN